MARRAAAVAGVEQHPRQGEAVPLAAGEDSDALVHVVSGEQESLRVCSGSLHHRHRASPRTSLRRPCASRSALPPDPGEVIEDDLMPRAPDAVSGRRHPPACASASTCRRRSGRPGRCRPRARRSGRRGRVRTLAPYAFRTRFSSSTIRPGLGASGNLNRIFFRCAGDPMRSTFSRSLIRL